MFEGDEQGRASRPACSPVLSVDMLPRKMQDSIDGSLIAASFAGELLHVLDAFIDRWMSKADMLYY